MVAAAFAVSKLALALDELAALDFGSGKAFSSAATSATSTSTSLVSLVGSFSRMTLKLKRDAKNTSGSSHDSKMRPVSGLRRAQSGGEPTWQASVPGCECG